MLLILDDKLQSSLCISGICLFTCSSPQLCTRHPSASPRPCEMSMNQTGMVWGTLLSLQRWVHDLIQSAFLQTKACVISKSPVSLLTSGSQGKRNNNPMTSQSFFFYNLIWLNWGGSCIPVISCLSVIRFKKNMPELFQAGQSVTWSICVPWGETGKNLEQGLVVTKTGSE